MAGQQTTEHETLSGVAHTSRTLVGRDAELAEVASLLGVRPSPDAGAGTGAGGRTVPPVGETRAVVLSGDAGVGMTRLLTELRDLAFTEGWQVVAGHCLDLADSSLPYLPFSEILGRVMADQPDVAARVLDQHPTLARLQPGRRVRGGETAPGDQALDRGNVYDADRVLSQIALAQSHVGSSLDAPTPAAQAYVDLARASLQQGVTALNELLGGEVARYRDEVAAAGIGLLSVATPLSTGE